MPTRFVQLVVHVPEGLDGVAVVAVEGARIVELYEASCCRFCHCTDEMGCWAGCSWVEPDLCSSCIGLRFVETVQPLEAFL